MQLILGIVFDTIFEKIYKNTQTFNIVENNYNSHPIILIFGKITKTISININANYQIMVIRTKH